MAAGNVSRYRFKHHIKRKGVHAKSKTTRNKNSKNYQKKYRGQGRA